MQKVTFHMQKVTFHMQKVTQLFVNPYKQRAKKSYKRY